MRRPGMFLFFCMLLLATPSFNIYSATLDCGGGIISIGDTRVDLLAKCGEPDHKESHNEEIIERFNDGSKRKLFVTVEDWTYNFGPAQFIRIVTLKNGRVADIRTGNYGYSKSPKTGQPECSEQVVTVGDTKSEVIAKCGEPTWKDTHQEEFKERFDNGLERNLFVTVEEWTYNLGPNRFVRILTFRNGKLTEIRSGGYGN